MKKIIPISEFTLNADVQGFYLCKKKSLRTTRAGELYIDLILQDKTGEISGKVWDRAEEFSQKFEKGDPLAVRGRIESYQDKLQLTIGRINKATVSGYGRYGFREEDLVPTSPYDSAKMWAEIGEILKKMENSFLKKLVTILYRENKKVLMKMPASISRHYPYRSGYLEHVISLAKVGMKLAKHYNADMDLLLAGIFLHGIGKVKELSDSLMPSFTDEGNFIGHTNLSRDMINSAVKEIKDFPSDLLTKLDHIIATHEGAYDNRYAFRPKIIEALLMQQLDSIDTKMSMFNRILDEDSEEGKWSGQRNVLGTSIYKGKTE